MALPFGVGGITLREPLGDGQVVRKVPCSRDKVLLRKSECAQPIQRSRSVALPKGVGRFDLHQSVGNCERVSEIPEAAGASPCAA